MLLITNHTPLSKARVNMYKYKVKRKLCREELILYTLKSSRIEIFSSALLEREKYARRIYIVYRFCLYLSITSTMYKGNCGVNKLFLDTHFIHAYFSLHERVKQTMLWTLVYYIVDL